MNQTAATLALLALLSGCALEDVTPPPVDASAEPADASDGATLTDDAPDARTVPSDTSAVDADVSETQSACPDHAERVGVACRCLAGFSACGASCVDLWNDPANCGTCGDGCKSGVCRYGSCVSIAPPPDAMPSVDVPADAGDLCRGACASLPNVARATCQFADRCGINECARGFADCDRIVENGCETNIFTRTNCGSCGIVCGAQRQCAGGVCR